VNRLSVIADNRIGIFFGISQRNLIVIRIYNIIMCDNMNCGKTLAMSDFKLSLWCESSSFSDVDQY